MTQNHIRSYADAVDSTTTQNNTQVTPNSLPTNPQSLIHRVMVFVLLFVFPPLAWFHMWKDHRYHKWFPYVLWVNGAILLGFSSYILTQLRLLLTNTVDESMILFVAHFLLLLFSFTEIGAGFYLKGIYKNNLRLRTKVLAIVILILLVNTIAIPISQFFFSMHVQKIASSATPISSPTPTVNPTANWKKYTDPFNFTISYPNDSNIEEANSKGTIPNLLEEINIIAPGGSSLLRIMVFTTDQTIEQYKKSLNYDPKNIEDTSISKESAIIFLDGWNKNLVVIHNRREYKFDNVADPFAQQILSTFKFTDADSTERANEKTLTSPDGKQTAVFYFKGKRGGEGDPNYTNVDLKNNLTGKTTTNQLDGAITWPSLELLTWSPLNNRIYFTHEKNGIGIYALWSSKIDGTDAKFVSGQKDDPPYIDDNTMKNSAVWGAGEIVFSSDGKKIATAKDEESTRAISPLWLMNYDGTNSHPVLLTGNFKNLIYSLRWQPDGKHIFFTTSDGKKEQSYQVAITGGSPAPLPPTTQQSQVACTQEAKLCPDGSYVARSGPKCEFTPCPK